MRLAGILDEMIIYWKTQDISLTKGCSDEAIMSFQESMNIVLPSDFVFFFKTVNGMESLYPNETDQAGFLFYPLNKIEAKKNGQSEIYLIFVDYMHRSWQYYLKILESDNYEIGITATEASFKKITNSLTDFLEYYMSDDEVLYDWKVGE